MAAIKEALQLALRKWPEVILLGEDIGLQGGAFGVTAGLWDEFGEERIIETPISENSFVGVAIGAAMHGLKPIVEIMFMDFITLAADQIINHASKIHYIYNGQFNVPLVIRTPAGGGRGYGPSHSQSLEPLFMSVPGLKIVEPSSAYDAKGLLLSSIIDPNPVLFIESKQLYQTYGDVPEEFYTIPLGQASILKEGKNISIISYGRMIPPCLKAAQKLDAEGISAEIIDLRTLLPFDLKTLQFSIEKTKRVLTVEEPCVRSGIGSEIIATLVTEDSFKNFSFGRLGMAHCPIPSSRWLENQLYPDELIIYKKAKQMVV